MNAVENIADLEARETAYWAEHGHRFGAWSFHPATGDVTVDGELRARLTQTEAETLLVLIRACPLPVPRPVLIDEMARIECYWNIDSVKVVVMRLRKKLGADLILTDHWRGYSFNPRAVLR